MTIKYEIHFFTYDKYLFDGENVTTVDDIK